MNKEVRSKINFQADDAPSTIQQDHHELFAVSMNIFGLNKSNKKEEQCAPFSFKLVHTLNCH